MKQKANRFTLVIGNKNYSSWSLRPWLVMKELKIPFEEIKVPIHTNAAREKIEKYSPSGRVPVLIDSEAVVADAPTTAREDLDIFSELAAVVDGEGVKVWDSLAICEYLNEQFPSLHLWPENSEARALARSISAEMHSGFTDLRSNMPMNCRASYPGKGMKPEVQEDIARKGASHPKELNDDIGRIQEIWENCRSRFSAGGGSALGGGKGGDFLFGKFCIADAMFAPVVIRFAAYEVPLGPVSDTYRKAVLGLPSMKEWIEAAKTEPEVIEDLEPYSVRGIP